MKFNLLTPKKALSSNKDFIKFRPTVSEITSFKANLLRLLGKIDEIEREENQKNHVRDFLRDTYYKDKNEINTKGTQDLVIHIGKDNKSSVGVIVEAKRPSNTAEWFIGENINRKVLQELILYFIRERIEFKNSDIKYLIATNIYQWYIIDASYFEKYFHRNREFVREYQKWSDGQKTTDSTGTFYKDIAQNFIDKVEEDIPCTYFDIRNYQKLLAKNCIDDDIELIYLFKILSPYHLLNEKFSNDSNTLNDGFYKELLHIIGLEENENKKIVRKDILGRDSGSLIENTISALETDDSIHKIPNIDAYGSTLSEQLFNIALDHCITWINRILFLKLLEGQLRNYHSDSPEYRFLNIQTVTDFHELFKLFHDVLAIEPAKRKTAVAKKYVNVPYLNSSLFDFTDLEDITIKINSLDSGETLALFSHTILKREKRENKKITTVDYLFKFLDAYDFSGEGTEKIQEDRATLINASVLGKVFEKINSYKDGAIFTPGFITMSICKKTARTAVLKKFKDNFPEWTIDSFEDVKNHLTNRKSQKEILQFNGLINSLKICDPAVGSGHFLVSMLNEIIAIKHDLGILADANGNLVSGYDIAIANDELVITDDEGDTFAYRIVNNKPLGKKNQTLQKVLFHEKQIIIEECLFGVDINPNSAKICRLRLWIELLKNAYYKEESNYFELETLPNIDINIKVGNSLLSRFKLKDDEFKNVPNFKKRIKEYTKWVNDYKNTKDREAKRNLNNNIKLFVAEFKKRDPKIVDKESKLRNLSETYHDKYEVQHLFQADLDELQVKAKEQLKREIEQKSDEIHKLRNNPAYRNAFEWRFEFPEVLDEDGEYTGFDIVVGNPPYISAIELKKLLTEQEYKKLKTDYQTAKGTVDLFIYFFEKGLTLIKGDGLLSYITPNRYLSASYGTALREMLYDQTEIKEIVDYSHVKVFKEASTYPIVTFLCKRSNRYIYKIRVGKYVNLTQSITYASTTSEKLNLFEGYLWGYLLNDKISITEKVISKAVTLAACGKINATSTASEADDFHHLINETDSFKLINTGTIDRYQNFWGKQKLIDKGQSFLMPYLPKGSKVISENREGLYNSPKIIIAKIALRLEAFYDTSGEYASINTNCIHSFNKDYHPKYILAWLNSKLFQYTFECFFEGLKMQGGYLLYSSPNLSKMFINKASPEIQAMIKKLVDDITTSIQNDREYQEYDKQIDQIFYDLFDLDSNEIAIVEDSIKAR